MDVLFFLIIGVNAWIAQEHQKGKTSLVSGFSDAEGGWGYNCAEADKWWRPNALCLTYSGTTPAVALAISDADLRLRPFFRPFQEDNVFSATVSTASNAAGDFRNHILAFGIPALSHAAGSTQLKGFDSTDSFNMNEEAFQKDWPQERPIDDQNWKHSDAKDIAYRYVYTLFDKWVVTGELDK